MKKQKLVALIISYTAAYFCLTANGQVQANFDGESTAGLGLRPIGEVSMLIGRAFLSTASGQEARVNRGDFLHEGSIIRTSSSGHVHIRFRDDAVMSVRPSSE